jgi:hypothetical protein
MAPLIEGHTVDRMSDFRVVIFGGGMAAVEGLLHLAPPTGKRVTVELIAPNNALVYRPMAVREPFGFGPPRGYPIASGIGSVSS